MIFNVTGGGGTSLNFKVVGGTTQPTSPKENTVWVNTDVDIPGYTISGISAPGWAMTAGWVYINAITGMASGSPEFNALKKNEILIIPNSVKQYVGSQWVDKEAKIYQGGQWVDWWQGQLYTSGNEHTEHTGGWAARAWKLRSVYTDKAPTLEKQAEAMIAEQTGSGSYVSGVVEILKDIDLTPYKTLSIEYTGSGVNSTHYFSLAAAERSATYYVDNALAETKPLYKDGADAKAIASLDVSGINQAVDVFVGMHLTQSMSGTATLTIHRVWLQ